jgi:DNA/RNA-binding domain of Phe-tRNA-synthetase-like protein
MVNKKMEVVIKAPVEVEEEDKKQTKEEFWKEFGRGYLEVEKMKNKELLKEYQEAYENIKNKNSFNAQYLETLIFNLKH